MAAFLHELAATHCVRSAARAVGMSRQSAYRLRARLKGEAFDIAWEVAVQNAYHALHQAALERALHEVEMPVYHRGELVGSRRAFDERLTCFLLSERNRHALGQDHDARLTLRHLADEFEELVECVRKGIPLIADDDAEEYDDDDEDDGKG